MTVMMIRGELSFNIKSFIVLSINVTGIYTLWLKRNLVKDVP